MAREQAPPNLPLRPSSNQANVGASSDQSSATTSKPSVFANHNGFGPVTSTAPSTSSTSSHRPAVKASAYGKNLDDKYSHLFIQPKSRPEHHRPTRINGPLGPSAKDKKPPPPPMFSTVPAGSATNPISVLDTPPRYTQPGFSSNWTDPKKTSADLQALIEGSLEDDEDEEEDDDDDDEKQSENDDGKSQSQIKGLNVRLLPHQVRGVEWMKRRELGPVKKGKVPKGGILADDMGLGKTLQSISLILTNRKPKDSDKLQGVESSTLVVAPLALIRQWEAELKDKIADSHKLKVLVHHGPQRTKNFKDLRRYDVVITTYQILVSEHGHTNGSVKAGCFGLHWYRVILDEAHTIKNRNAKSTKACYDLRSVYRWCLSGTPMQNNLDELQSLVKFLRIKPYDDLAEWKHHIEAPMKRGEGDVAIQRLHSILRCFMKRRTKEILKEPGALDAGGSKSDSKDGEEKSATSDFKITERKVVSLQAKFSPAERRFYDRLELRTDKSIQSMMKSKNVNYANALVLLLRLRQVCNHPKLVEGKLEKDREALNTETKPKKNDADVDELADLLGGLDVQARHCDICGWELDKDNRVQGKDMCKSCSEDLEYFNNHDDGDDPESPKKVRKPKAKVKKVVREQVKTELVKRKPRNRKTVVDSDDEGDQSIIKPARKPRNRAAIIDSDDEEDEGSWIVSGDEQGPLRLGKAGGTDDENAEGEGESINTADSESDSEEDGSKLDSFIVRDEEDTKPEDADKTLDDSESEEEFESISVIKSKVEAEKARAALKSESSSEETEDSDSEDGIEDDLDSDSDEDQSLNPWSTGRHRNKEKTPLVLASAKIRELMKILHNEVDDHKFIVFSQFTSMLDIVERFFKKDGIRYTRYDGGMRNDAREAALDSLRNDPRTRVLLCSLRCGALGLNLTAASRVVILEPFWNPFVEEQAIDRVHRLTQKVDVVVYKLTVENTVEERILELQNKKRLLAEQAIEGGMRKDGLKLGLKELMDLFRPVGNNVRIASPEDYYDAQQIGRDLRAYVKRPKQKPTQENSVYGRRW
ncbi:hypothetical protein PFICI_14308 [Pestalotiopsis fici W106-1]|uniref:ATP-dependent helicase n=1 Tax=Pestalotiopsis fici (strain W106-1 / CGMCC3.15140) TaxID=1229662 RepID=W3WMQ8_PESFW|nr:uncharacterized protein PFICI_14308 [Pestalotiopsis fici W106-1]ETS74442.1 hypothetical protein PFICI_14308 [Pestalotiopsis fici W106-1]